MAGQGCVMQFVGNRERETTAARWALLLVLFTLTAIARAQENPLGDVHTPTPPAPTVPKDNRPLINGSDDVTRHATSSPASNIRVSVNLVLVPATVTDPMNRLVTG